MSEGFILIGAFVGIFIFFVFTYFVPVGLWISAIASDVSVSPLDFIGMRFRRVSPHAIINPAIMVKKGGIEIGLQALESHFLAGGNVSKVCSALIAAQKAGINLSFKQATAIDLAGRDVLDAVKLCVKPKVIQTPLVAAMAKNGIQVKAIARVTVKADITNSSAAPPKKLSLPALAKVSLPPLVRPPATKKFSKIPTEFQKPFRIRVLMLTPLSKFFRSISPTSMLAKTSAPNCRSTSQKPI